MLRQGCVTAALAFNRSKTFRLNGLLMSLSPFDMALVNSVTVSTGLPDPCCISEWAPLRKPIDIAMPLQPASWIPLL